jgi:diguanylate cyclase
MSRNVTAEPLNDVERAKKIAENVFTHMQNCNISANPNNYKVWFEFFSGDNPELKTKLKSMIESNIDFKGEVNEEIFNLFFGETSHIEKADEWGQRIEEVAGHILRAVESTGKDTEDFGDALRSFSGNLSNLENFEDVNAIKSLVAGALNDTKTMAVHMETLRSQVTSSTDEITQLKQELETTRRDALTDGLTGVANRKCFDQTLRRAAAEADKTNAPLSLILADLDHFKVFNDNHGHQVGDQVLKVVGRALIDCIKGQDTAARYGGEEFAVILPNTTVGSAAAVAETIRKTISSKKLKKKGVEGTLGPITASLGVSDYVPGEPIKDLIERADRALYEAKNFGRNRVMSEEGSAMKAAG